MKKSKILKKSNRRSIDQESIWEIWKKLNLKKKKIFGNEKKMTWNNTRDLNPFMQSHKTLHKERGSGQYTGKSLSMLHIPHTMVNAKMHLWNLRKLWFDNVGNFKLIDWDHLNPENPPLPLYLIP